MRHDTGQLLTAAHPEPATRPQHARLDGSDRQHEGVGDLSVRPALRGQQRHFELPARKPRAVRGGGQDGAEHSRARRRVPGREGGCLPGGGLAAPGMEGRRGMRRGLRRPEVDPEPGQLPGDAQQGGAIPSGESLHVPELQRRHVVLDASDHRAELVGDEAWIGPQAGGFIERVDLDSRVLQPGRRQRQVVLGGGGEPPTRRLEHPPGVPQDGLGSGGDPRKSHGPLFELVEGARRAIFTAIDTRDVRARLFGTLEPPLRTNHLFSVRSPHHKDLLTGAGFGTGDLDAARRILREAGYRGFEAGGQLTRNGEAVGDLRFAFLSGHPTRGTLVEVVQARLREIGITITPMAVPGNKFGATLLGGDFDLVVLAFDGGPLFTQTPALFFGSKSGVNFSRLSDPAIDTAAGQVLEQVSVGAAAAKANEVVGLVMQNASMLPLWDNLTFAFVRDGFVNVRDNLQSSVRAMYNIVQWGAASATR